MSQIFSCFNIQYIFLDHSASIHLSILLNPLSSILLSSFIKSNIAWIMVFFSAPIPLYQPVWLGSHVCSLHPDKTACQYYHYSLLLYLFFLNYLLMFSKSSFVIHSFFLIIFAWSHKRYSVISMSYRSFRILCILVPYPPISLLSSSTGLFKK